ncbi:uncharacterized protein OCT59_019154 [Rhizophagus irregularis]|uniref:uncharacterized protein n=1 Tax=Rhizophagus irregularis TaxID=588596 RepID=UPI00333080BD|nr:hypothetical protein OCT59_019154 [Rhizophagus irregularis]
MTFQDSNKKNILSITYVAPEVLRGKEYTQASDIYGFGIIAYEICTGLPPYYDIAHDEFLAMKIYPLKRLNAGELSISINKLYINHNVDIVINKPIKEADEINKKSSSTVQSPLSSTNNLLYTTHPQQAIYTSRLLDFENLPEPKNADNNEYSCKHI